MTRGTKIYIMNTVRNSVQLIGNVGKDVEFKTLDSGSSVANFSLATNDFYKNKDDEKVQETQWHNIEAWGKTAELMNTMLVKGSQVLVKGKLISQSYDDKEGNKKYITKVKASEFQVFDKKDVPF